MLFAPWAPHLHLRAHEEPIEAGTLPRFIETPTATTTHKPKPGGKFVTLPVDAEQSTTRQRQEEIPREQSQPASSSSCAAADTSMQVPDHIPKPARQLSPAEREESIRKRQRPAAVNTALTRAGVYNGNEITSCTEDQKAQTLQKKRAEDQNTHTTYFKNYRNFSTCTSLVWWKWSTGRNHHKFSRHTGYRNNGRILQNADRGKRI